MALRGSGHDKSSLFPEDGDVGDGGGEEEGAVAADRNHLGRVEAHVARQLWIEGRRERDRLGKLFIEGGHGWARL